MTIEERLEVVERELAVSRRGTRRMWVALGLAGAVCAIVWSFTATTDNAQAQGAEKFIRANQFILEDENGKVRAVLYTDKDEPNLSLFDESGKGRAVLRATKNGPSLALYDENGNGGAILDVSKEGSGLMLLDENEKPRAQLSANKDGSWLGLFDENRKVIWKTP